MIAAPSAALDQDRLRRLERILALARVCLAVLAQVVLALEPVDLSGASALLTGLLSAYTAYAALVALIVILPVRGIDAWNAALHGLDVVWALAVTSVSAGPTSIFFVFFVFVVVGAAYRWGLRETVVTGALSAVILLAEALAPLPGSRAWTAAEIGPLVTRCTYVLGLACLVGYLAEEQNRVRRQDGLTARILSAVSLTGGFRTSLRGVLVELLDAFDARRAALAVENRATGFLYAWTLPDRDADLQLTASSADRERWWCALPPGSGAWLIAGGRRGPAIAGAPRRSAGPVPPTAALGRLLDGSRRVLIGDVDVGEEWRGRLVLYDPRAADDRARRWLSDVLPRLGSALYSVYLLSRLRERATSAERARIARELHDGLIQSLVGLEMRVQVLTRQPEMPPNAVAELTAVQAQLHEEAVGARELMQEITPVETDGTDVPAALASVVERFRRDTGIDTRFACDLTDPVVPPRAARELVRMAQEALVNVRRHSGAARVSVEFGATADQWRLAVDDNGGGFDFEGRLSMEDLDRARRGPLVIKQRVRGLGGALTIASSPGSGARLEISVPRRTR